MSLKDYEQNPYTVYIVRCTLSRGSIKHVGNHPSYARTPEEALMETYRTVLRPFYDFAYFEVVQTVAYMR